MKINEFSAEVYKLQIPSNFKIRFRSEGRIFIIDNVIKEVDSNRNIIYLEGYETPFKN